MTEGDPAACAGSDARKLRVFRAIYFEPEGRIQIFTTCRSRRSTG
jgi:hypothetical protein